jgi:carboxymethylenebutenolidase
MTSPSGTSPQNTSFPSGGGTAHGYLALPPSGSGPGLVVIQEWWGLTTHIQDVTDRFAAEGFVALAPDLYGGRTTHDAAEARELATSLPRDRAVRDLAGAVDHLLGHDAVTSTAVGAVGFCMGGGFVLSMAAQLGDKVSAAVAFYGIAGDSPSFTTTTARVQGHYGRLDHTIPVEAVEEMAARIERESGKAPEIHLYDAGHAFLNDENPKGNYDAASASLAWGRAVEFLR